MGLKIEKFYYTGSTQVWVAPPTVTKVLVFIIGGGGGGGGGMNGNNTTTLSPGGGGGGGGAIEISSWVDVVPGRSYNLVVGQGGSGGANGLPPTDGGDGSPSYIEDSVTGHFIIWASGAQGGEAGKNGALSLGGMSQVTGSSTLRPAVGSNGLGTIYPGMGGWGGARGSSPTDSWPGCPSIRGGQSISGMSLTDNGGFAYPAGVSSYCNGHPKAADSGSFAGGGAGGGGGPATISAIDLTGVNPSTALDTGGGTGGAGNNSGVGGSGQGFPIGERVAIGHGGGGGGGGGCGSSGGGLGGRGRDGGNGRIVLIYMAG